MSNIIKSLLIIITVSFLSIGNVSANNSYSVTNGSQFADNDKPFIPVDDDGMPLIPIDDEDSNVKSNGSQFTDNDKPFIPVDDDGRPLIPIDDEDSNVSSNGSQFADNDTPIIPIDDDGIIFPNPVPPTTSAA